MSGWQQVTFAFRCFFSILFEGSIPEDIAQELCKKSRAAEPVDNTTVGAQKRMENSVQDDADRAVQMLALLQRDGRLVDFLAEDIAGYPDAQLGAAVRSIHESCRKLFDTYVKIAPVFESPEDQSVTVQANFDPSAIKLIGNVTGTPPLRGLLRHKGWRVTEVKLPPLSQPGGRTIIAPAEIELM